MKYAILLFTVLMSATGFAQRGCDTTKTHIVSQHKEHEKYFLFFKQNRKKHIHTEKAIDGNGKVLVKTTMRSVCSYDACDGGAFKRVVLINGEIHKVYAGRFSKKGRVKRYDLCGRKISTEKIDPLLFEETYSFNAIPAKDAVNTI